MATAAEPPRRTIHFAGRRWWIKRASQPVGPGPNRFHDSTASVEVNADGGLVLRVRRTGGQWVCAEVVGEEATGYGRYEWTIRTDLTDLDRHVVLGMFTWSDDPDLFHRELDIEVSAWGRDGGIGGQFVVQPQRHPVTCGRSWCRTPPRGSARSTGRLTTSRSGLPTASRGRSPVTECRDQAAHIRGSTCGCTEESGRTSTLPSP